MIMILELKLIFPPKEVTFVTSSDFLISISLLPNCVDLLYFNLFDQIINGSHPRCGIPASVNEGIPAYTTSSLWNGMINPLKRNAVTGFLWYQGESNAERNR